MDWHYGRGTMGKASGIHKGKARQWKEMCHVTSSYLRLHKHWFTTKQLRMVDVHIWDLSCFLAFPAPSEGARSSNAPSDVHPEKTKLLIIRRGIGGHFRICTITCIWCTFNFLLQVGFSILGCFESSRKSVDCFCVSRAVSHQRKTAKSC